MHAANTHRHTHEHTHEHTGSTRAFSRVSVETVRSMRKTSTPGMRWAGFNRRKQYQWQLDAVQAPTGRGWRYTKGTAAEGIFLWIQNDGEELRGFYAAQEGDLPPFRSIPHHQSYVAAFRDILEEFDLVALPGQPAAVDQDWPRKRLGVNWPTQRYLEAVCAAVRLHGWQNSRAEVPTWHRARQIVAEQELASITLEDIQQAEEIFQAFHPEVVLPAERTEFLTRLIATLNTVELPETALPIAAAAPVCLTRRKAQQDRARRAHYVGEVGQIFLFDSLEMMDARFFDGHYGPSWLYKFQTPDGAQVITFLDAKDQLPEGVRYFRGTGRVKRHHISPYDQIMETLVENIQLSALPICPFCGGDRDRQECSCIEIDHRHWQPVGAFDIEIEMTAQEGKL